jgi:hypothetical protein
MQVSEVAPFSKMQTRTRFNTLSPLMAVIFPTGKTFRPTAVEILDSVLYLPHFTTHI